MKSSLLVVATAIIFALIGLQGAHLLATKKPHQRQKCTDDNCKVAVTIDASDYCYVGSCDISVEYELTETQGHHISFDLDEAWVPRFQFPDDGIVFDPAGGFSCGKVNAKKIKCTNDKPNEYGVYKYTVKLRDTNRNNDLTLDPWVVNR
jgi:hypothetical protein